MRHARTKRTLPAIGLGLGLALTYPLSAFGQGSGLSSGSGAGTGTGSGSVIDRGPRTGLGATSGASTGVGRDAGGPQGVLNPGDLTRPADRQGVGALPPGANGANVVDPQLFIDARSVADPGERALALIRIAHTATFSKQLTDAHTALFEAGPAALAEPDPLVREQRITAIIAELLKLAEERMSDTTDLTSEMPLDLKSPVTPPPVVETSPPAPGVPTPPAYTVDGRVPAAALPPNDRKARLNAALPEWAKAVELALKLEKISARTESLCDIVENESFNSCRLITDSSKGTGRRPDPTSQPADLREYTDNLMRLSAEHAQMIERPIWRNFAKYKIVANAAVSSQFLRGFEIARSIEQPEARAGALIRLAEGQAVNARPNEATAAYEEAARSVALIPQDDPRETLIGVLIDSLISFGRFDDARACVPLYLTAERQLIALCAVAESQGRRNLAESARAWIGKDTPESFRPLLYRKVNDGILAAIEQNRSKDLSLRGR